MGEYHPRSFWSGPSETRSVQQRLRAIFSQYRPKLVRVLLLKKIIIGSLLYIIAYMYVCPWALRENLSLIQGTVMYILLTLALQCMF